ncbi:hypothetical protein ON010_g623 [Phytophthora cinnamomi]|nr:hypothetical protein ON010_g623 [Phytophthora cinnamomi]
METPVPGSRPYLEVLFPGDLYIRYDNPSEYVCRSFDCPGLPRAVLVQWANLPLHKVAAFYETPDCTYREGYSTYNSGSARQHVTGSIPLEGVKMVRSMMLGRNEDAVLEEKLTATSVSRSCAFFHFSPVFDSATLDGNATDGNVSYEVEWVHEGDATGGLSANWSEELPGSSSTAGSGSDEGEVTVAGVN